MRRPIIAANWKMHKTIGEAVALTEELVSLIADAEVDVVICTPFICLSAVKDAIAGTKIHLGAQNLHFKENGAYTGEISSIMLKELGVEYVIIGHSERRQYFAETDETVNLKVKAAIGHGLIPIICVGENLLQREQGITDELVSMQTKLALCGVSSKETEKLVLAYEPIWAIGTGMTATKEQANDTISKIRKAVAELHGDNTASKVRILYGGSINRNNISGLMREPEIDGGLIGGASLNAEEFAKIVKY
ncbi:MAG: triose-phosphate isomerase [Eubacteriales bacterium]